MKIESKNCNEKYFFDIPVFRCTIGQWSEEKELEKNKLFDYFRNLNGNNFPNFDYKKFANKVSEKKFSSFYYSEMIGMIKLFAIRNQIRGELWFVKQKLSKNLKNKSWHFVGKLFEYFVKTNDTNEQIFKFIIEDIENQKKLKKRYIDIESFLNSGKYIDFIKLSKL